jgi:hypothetical protein
VFYLLKEDGFKLELEDGSGFLLLDGAGDEVVSRGGINPHEYSEYRKYLEKLNGIKNLKAITPEIIEAAQAVTEIPLVTKQVSQITFETPKIDFAALELELSNIQRYIDRMEFAAIQAQRFLREQDDEIALLMMIN